MARASPLLLVSEECKYAASFSANLLITLQETTKTSLIGSGASNSFLQHSVSMFLGSLSSKNVWLCLFLSPFVNIQFQGAFFSGLKNLARAREKIKIQFELKTTKL